MRDLLVYAFVDCIGEEVFQSLPLTMAENAYNVLIVLGEIRHKETSNDLRRNRGVRRPRSIGFHHGSDRSGVREQFLRNAFRLLIEV